MVLKAFVIALFCLQWVTEAGPTTRVPTITSVKGRNPYELLYGEVALFFFAFTWATRKYLNLSAGFAGDDKGKGKVFFFMTVKFVRSGYSYYQQH